MKDTKKQREIEEAQRRMRQQGNAEYEHALKFIAASDVKLIVHFLFLSWAGVLRNPKKKREIEETQQGNKPLSHEHFVGSRRTEFSPLTAASRAGVSTPNDPVLVMLGKAGKILLLHTLWKAWIGAVVAAEIRRASSYEDRAQFQMTRTNVVRFVFVYIV